MSWQLRRLCLICFSVSAMVIASRVIPVESKSMADSWQAGAAKVDITPTEPVRLSGYGSRKQATIQVDDPLSVRALALKYGDQAPLVLVSLDAIGLSASLTDRIAQQLSERYALPRERLVLCNTHSHTAPHLEDALPNLFSAPMTDEEREQMMRYSQRLVEAIVQVVGESIDKLQPARVTFGTGQAEFAMNRRKIQGNTWTGFGTSDTAPVDRTVRVIRAQRENGTTLAVAYQYACHCTSIEPNFNRISGDWAGLSSTMIEEELRQSGSVDAIALPVIGCGADANPNPRGTYENAQRHALEMAQSVRDVCKKVLEELPAPQLQVFEWIAIASERPSREHLESMLKKESYVERHFAQMMLDILKHKDRLPETYPAPVHLWSFGDQLAWVFMSGEVVVDYQLRLERELSQFRNVWVAGYVDDVFAYIASERVRGEGGYEVDSSMLYYAQPGRWVSGTEDVLVTRILEMASGKRRLDQPLSPDEALASMEMPPGWKIELVASEPLVTDPVNIAFGPDGSVWVVEMGDYPTGGSKSGQILKLVDSDRDGRLDTKSVFLDNLAFPAGVYAWRDGVVVACAPDVFWARDTDGDGVADERRVLLTGFALANPQHRVNGFSYGLDHRLHLGVGAGAGEIEEVATGKRMNVGGCDLSLDVDSGRVFLETGSTQYIRSCDAWGNWFGNDNSHPVYHYAWDRRWLDMSRQGVSKMSQHLMQPPSAPPVFPVSRDADRFNDLFAANRFTSACSTIFCKSPGAEEPMQGCALVCESVHNLVSRIRVEPAGGSFSGRRFEEDLQSEWLRSSDPWFRPVRLENGADGTIWVVDMYRRVIEHPEWIPDDWQRRLDLRAGEHQGRIYRTYRTNFHPFEKTNWSRAPIDVLLQGIQSPSSTVADLASQQLVWRIGEANFDTTAAANGLRKICAEAKLASVRLRAIAALVAMELSTASDWDRACRDSDPRVVRWAIGALASRGSITGEVKDLIQSVALSEMASRSAPLASHLIAALASTNSASSYTTIADLLAAHAGDPWVDQAVVLVPESGIDAVIQQWLKAPNLRVAHLLDQLIPAASDSMKLRLREGIVRGSAPRPAWHYTLGSQFAASEEATLQLNRAMQQRLRQDAEQAFQNPQSSSAVRLAAFAFWRTQKQDRSQSDIGMLAELLVDCNDDELRRAAIGFLATTSPEQWASISLQWNRYSAGTKTNLLSQLVSREENASVVLDLVRTEKMVVADFQPSQIEQLRTYANVEFQKQVEAIFGPPPGSDRMAIVADYAHRWPSRVDPERGEMVYKQHCAQCHRDRMERGERIPAVGPNLQALAHWKNEAWLVSILDPNRAVEPKYRRMSIRTEDGQTLVGLKIRDDSKAIEIVNDQGQVVRLQREEIDAIRESDKSLMPEGFERLLAPEDVANLISYIRKSRE